MGLTEELITEIQALCQAEDRTLWQQGDLLVAAALSEAEFAKLAELVGRTAGTLRDRERVSREVPRDRRDSRHSWSIYRQLIRISDEDARWAILDSRSSWTVDAISLEVQRWLQMSQPGRKAAEQKIVKSGMRLGDIKVRAELDGNTLTMMIDSPGGISTSRIVEISDHKSQIIVNL